MYFQKIKRIYGILKKHIRPRFDEFFVDGILGKISIAKTYGKENDIEKHQVEWRNYS